MIYKTALFSIVSIGMIVTSNASSLEFAFAQSNPPPPPSNPGSSSAGGRRDPSTCPQDAEAVPTTPVLTALSPKPKAGLTLAEHPTFLVYVPKTSAKNAEFSLRDRAGHGVYRAAIALTNTPDLIRITLPVETKPLEMDQQYTWSFAMICNPADRLSDRFVTGMIQRTQLDPTRLRQLEQSQPGQRVSLYQQNDIWYDALALLFELKYRQPPDPSIIKTWREFLQSGQVDPSIEIPSN
jgi:hypothetical protein